mgnify:CR=1 FL=1
MVWQFGSIRFRLGLEPNGQGGWRKGGKRTMISRERKGAFLPLESTRGREVSVREFRASARFYLTQNYTSSPWS